MGQAANPITRKDNQAKAVLRLLRISPQKLNLLAKSIRGMKAEAALAELAFSRKRHAIAVRDTLKSAIANAENNHQLDIDALIVEEAYTGKNLVMKRIRPRARGRSARIIKPFSQLTIVLRDSSMENGEEERES